MEVASKILVFTRFLCHVVVHPFATRRTHIYQVRLSDLELDWLRMKARDAGVFQSILIRRLTLSKSLPKRISKISFKNYQ